jgi:hypothetical protein
MKTPHSHRGAKASHLDGPITAEILWAERDRASQPATSARLPDREGRRLSHHLEALDQSPH